MVRQPLCILLVEDDSMIASVIALGLRTLGMSYKLDTAYSAEEGWELFEQNAYDLVMSDYNLRGMNGLSLLIKIKQAQPNLPTVLFTAYDTPKLRHDAYNAGINQYIAKPFLIEDFVNIARNLLPAIENEIGASPS
ncbi:MAG: response regulator [Roseiflexus sp.]